MEQTKITENDYERAEKTPSHLFFLRNYYVNAQLQVWAEPAPKKSV